MASATASTARGQETVPTWETPAVFSVGAFPFGIDAADAVGDPQDPETLDGYPDVVITDGQIDLNEPDSPDQYTWQPGELVVYQNTGDWSPPTDGLEFFQSLSLPTNTVAAEVVWADITGDDRLDIVCTASDHYNPQGSGGSWGVYVFEWDDSVELFASYQAVLSNYPLRGLVCEDFDDDGDIDVLAAIDWPEPDTSYPDRVAFCENLGGTPGSYTLDDEFLISGLGSDYDFATGQVVAAQFDKTPGGNKYPDVFAPLFDQEGSLLTGTSSGFTATELSISGCTYGDAMGMAAGRFEQGKLTDDFAMATLDGAVMVYHTTSSGTFMHNCDPNDDPNDIYFEGGCCGASSFDPHDIASGHLNGGTKLDLVLSGPTDYAWVLLGDGNGGFEWSSTDADYKVPLDHAMAPIYNPIRIIIADMDQDGFGDVLTANHGTDDTEGTISVVINALSICP